MNREKQIEESFIRELTEQLKYVYRDDIHDRASLEANFRQKFETLNKVKLSDSEFDRLLEEVINPDVFVSSKRLRERNTFTREDGTPLQYTLVNIKDWCKNDYEVINQLRMNTDNSYHRYDVILLINGIPVVQIELKTYDVSPRRAMQQIVDYKNDPGNGYMKTLLCFIQLFVVSNQTNTYYFTNNNNQHFSFNADEQFLPVYQYATGQNTPVSNLDTFSSAVLTKCELGKMISLYMVLVASEQKLLIMRPYQIYAVKAIMNCVHQNRGNGYIWHTTGSGKTLTSFKASTLMKDNPDIDKCLFVVDRKDLDRQTREEFNKFQENCVEENTNTEMLVRRMLSDDYADKVIVTTIQKLGIALDPKHKKNYQARLEPLKNKRVVFIFDECHRSQFGNNHKAIKDIFEKLLHAYTITNAIEDNNVLRFHVDYFKPKEKNQTKNNEISKTAIVNSILQRHDAATDSRRFNAIMATGGINDAIEYYNLFKTVQQERKTQNPEYKSLNIACIFSPPAEGNKDIQQIQEDLPQERFDNQQEPDKKKAALKMIIADYNGQYGTNHTIAEFDTYYQDVQGRIKSQKYSNKDVPHKDKIDITIVVDMLLTGFDSKYLNTLYTDKDMKWHNLIQAFSRTNRILNDTKPYGNILDFRGLEEAVDEAIAMFSEKHTDNPKQIWLVDPAPKVIEKYEEAISQLEKFMQSHGLECKPEEVNKLRGDEARAGFINCFKEVQRFRMRLEQYTDIQSDDKAKIDSLMQEDTLRAFKGIYIDTARRLKKKREKRGGEQVSQQIEDLDFEFILFASAIIDYDYIMGLIARYTNRGTAKKRITKEQLITLVASSANLMEEKEDIVAYINSLDEINGKTEQEIKDGYEFFKEAKYKNEITAIATKYGLEFPALDAFVKEIVEREIFDGERLSDLLAPLGLGWKARTQKELALMDDLVPLLKRLADGHEISGLSAYEN